GVQTCALPISTSNEVGLETLIRGHKANLYLNGRRLTMRPERIWAEEVEEQTLEGEGGMGAQDLLRLHWLHCIRTRERPLSAVELGTEGAAVVDLATRSLWEGKAFAFDPERLEARAI